MKKWDVFISHASEDKEAVALPLARALQKAGLRVWLDRQELQIGDSLREKIDEGLASSRFGVVILSRAFLAKGWPKRELNGLMAIEDDGRKVILPVWHKLERASLVVYSPILADRLAADTAQGIPTVAADIARVVLRNDSGSPSVHNPTLARRFIELLDDPPEAASVKAFLAVHPDIIRRALGGKLVGVDVELGSVTADFCVGTELGTARMWTWHVVLLGPVDARPILDGVTPEPGLIEMVATLNEARNWAKAHQRAAGRRLTEVVLALFLPGAALAPTMVRSRFRGIIVFGRRNLVTAGDVNALRDYNQSLRQIRIRTYDWLAETALKLQTPP
jgi:hypothetical protein